MTFIDFKDAIIYALVFIVFMPILTIIHEIGHAIPALIFTNGEVSVNIGNYNLIKKIKINRLTININGYKSLVDISYGYIKCTDIDSKLKSILVFAGGPVSSLFISLLSFLYLKNTNLLYIPMIIFNAISMFSFVQFMSTILPIKYKTRPYNGFTSDGYKILQLLKMTDYNK
ncbi:hypothetical protein TPELB_24180 [Terrisporobacter petrolearius]|uniref:Peptidase family M50 n=1 Tax=Terrisporobacter petrolearius TaxID=1460447 RepID=A0ABZ3FE51_9FIRM